MITVSPPYWFTYPYGDRDEVRVCDVTDIPTFRLNEAWFTDAGAARVDASIAPLVAKLNRMGLTTEFCCSALRADHRSDILPGAGYILFTEDVRATVRLWLTPPLYLFDEHNLRVMDGATDETLAAAWRALEFALDRSLRPA